MFLKCLLRPYAEDFIKGDNVEYICAILARVGKFSADFGTYCVTRLTAEGAGGYFWRSKINVAIVLIAQLGNSVTGDPPSITSEGINKKKNNLLGAPQKDLRRRQNIINKPPFYEANS